MRDPHPQFVASCMIVLGIFVGTAVGQLALADSEKPAAPSAEPGSAHEPVAAPISAPEAIATSASAAEAVAPPLTGPQVYRAVCIACHAAPGVGGAPALGDGDAWAARIAQGIDTLVGHALNGYSGSTGIMPRKGGRIDLSDEDIIAAVEYMVDRIADLDDQAAGKAAR